VSQTLRECRSCDSSDRKHEHGVVLYRLCTCERHAVGRGELEERDGPPIFIHFLEQKHRANRCSLAAGVTFLLRGPHGPAMKHTHAPRLPLSGKGGGVANGIEEAGGESCGLRWARRAGFVLEYISTRAPPKCARAISAGVSSAKPTHRHPPCSLGGGVYR